MNSKLTDLIDRITVKILTFMVNLFYYFEKKTPNIDRDLHPDFYI